MKVLEYVEKGRKTTGRQLLNPNHKDMQQGNKLHCSILNLLGLFSPWGRPASDLIYILGWECRLFQILLTPTLLPGSATERTAGEGHIASSMWKGRNKERSQLDFLPLVTSADSCARDVHGVF